MPTSDELFTLRPFLADKNEEALATFVGVHTCVDLEWLTHEDLEHHGVELEEQEAR